ncbi:MAG: hypothetical protein K9W46_10605 [Candidatus Heimdallarchaeum endolithica]|uniref:Uncharacterized protein n=1 Tax=Candidatus Heimdallarchaeum endolithica TaxID=2876572 RepID=A0A9Y1FML4_9ARCH|nr:MAG: hypothetical protein K9W46_10605 [Candidatus Heimdallarchaeum endolithica]
MQKIKSKMNTFLGKLNKRSLVITGVALFISVIVILQSFSIALYPQSSDDDSYTFFYSDFSDKEEWKGVYRLSWGSIIVDSNFNAMSKKIDLYWYGMQQLFLEVKGIDSLKLDSSSAIQVIDADTSRILYELRGSQLSSFNVSVDLSAYVYEDTSALYINIIGSIKIIDYIRIFTPKLYYHNFLNDGKTFPNAYHEFNQLYIDYLAYTEEVTYETPVIKVPEGNNVNLTFAFNLVPSLTSNYSMFAHIYADIYGLGGFGEVEQRIELGYSYTNMSFGADYVSLIDKEITLLGNYYVRFYLNFDCFETNEEDIQIKLIAFFIQPHNNVEAQSEYVDPALYIRKSPNAYISEQVVEGRVFNALTVDRQGYIATYKISHMDTIFYDKLDPSTIEENYTIGNPDTLVYDFDSSKNLRLNSSGYLYSSESIGSDFSVSTSFNLNSLASNRIFAGIGIYGTHSYEFAVGNMTLYEETYVDEETTTVKVKEVYQAYLHVYKDNLLIRSYALNQTFGEGQVISLSLSSKFGYKAYSVQINYEEIVISLPEIIAIGGKPGIFAKIPQPSPDNFVSFYYLSASGITEYSPRRLLIYSKTQQYVTVVLKATRINPLSFSSEKVVIDEKKLSQNKEGILYFSYIPKPFEYIHLEVYCTNPDEELTSSFSILAMKFSGIHEYNTIIPSYDYYDISDSVYFEKRNLISEDLSDNFIASYDAIVEERYSLLEIGAEAQDSLPDTQIDIYTRKLNSGLPFTFQGTVYWTEHESGSFFSHVLYLDLSPGNYEIRLERPLIFTSKLNISYLLLRPLTSYANAVTDSVGFTNPLSWEKDFTTDKIDAFNGIDQFIEESYYSLVHPSCYMKDDGNGNYEQYTDWTPSTDDTQIWSVEDNLASFVGGVKLDIPDVSTGSEGYPYLRFVARTYSNYTIDLKLTLTYSDGSTNEYYYSVSQEPKVYFFNFDYTDSPKILSGIEFFTNYILYNDKDESVIVSDIHLYRFTNIEVKLEDQSYLDDSGFDTSDYSGDNFSVAPFLSDYYGLLDIDLNYIPSNERVKVWTDNDAEGLKQYYYNNNNHYLLPSTVTVPINDWRVNKGASVGIYSTPLTSLNLNFMISMDIENRKTFNEDMTIELFEYKFKPNTDAYATSLPYSYYKLKFYLYGSIEMQNEEGEMEGGYLYYRLFAYDGVEETELTPTYDMLSDNTDFLQAISTNTLDFPNMLRITDNYEKGITHLIYNTNEESELRAVFPVNFEEAYTISIHFGQDQRIEREYADADSKNDVFDTPFFVGVSSFDTFLELYEGSGEKATLLFADVTIPSSMFPSLFIQTSEAINSTTELSWETDYSINWTPEPTFYVNSYEPSRNDETGYKPLAHHINLFENRYLLLEDLKTIFEEIDVTPYLVNENYGDFLYLPKYYSATLSTFQDVYVTNYDLSFEGTGNFQLIGNTILSSYTFDYNDEKNKNWKNEFIYKTVSSLKFISTYEKDSLPKTYLSCLDYLSYEYYAKNKKREYSFTDGFTNYEDWTTVDFSLFERVKEPSLRSSPLGLVIDENSIDFTNENMDSIYDYFDPTDELEDLFSFSGKTMYYLPSYYMKGGDDQPGHSLWDRVLAGEAFQGFNPSSSPYYQNQQYLYNNWMYDLQSQIIQKEAKNIDEDSELNIYNFYDEFPEDGLDFSCMLPDYLRFKPVYYSASLPKDFIWSFDINVDSWSLGNLAEDYVKFFDKEEGRYSFYITIPIILPSHGNKPYYQDLSPDPNVLRLFIYYDSGTEYHDSEIEKGYVKLDPHYSIYLGRSIIGVWKASESVSLHFEIAVEEKEIDESYAIYQEGVNGGPQITAYYDYNLQMWINNDNMYWDLLKLPMWMLTITYPYKDKDYDAIENTYQYDLMYNQLFNTLPSENGYINPQYFQAFNTYYKGLYGDKEPTGFQIDGRLFFDTGTLTEHTYHWLQYQRSLVSDKYYSLSLSEYGIDPSDPSLYDLDYHYYSRDNYAGMVRSDMADVRFENPRYVRGEYDWFNIANEIYENDFALYNIDYALDNSLYKIPQRTIGFGVNYPFVGISDVSITPLNSIQTTDLDEDGEEDFSVINGEVATDGENVIVKPGSAITSLDLSNDLDIAIKYKDIISSCRGYYDKTLLDYSFEVGLQDLHNPNLKYYFYMKNRYPYNQYFEYKNSEQIDSIDHFGGDDSLPSLDSGITQPLMGTYVGIKGYAQSSSDYSLITDTLSSTFKRIFQPKNSILYDYLNIKYDVTTKILTFILWSEKYGNKQSYEISYNLSETGELGTNDLTNYTLYFKTENAYLFIDKIYTRTFMPVEDTNSERYYRGAGKLGDYYLYSPVNHGLELQNQVKLSYEDYNLNSFPSTEFYFIPTSESSFSLDLFGIKSDDTLENFLKLEINGKECKLSLDSGDSWNSLNNTEIENMFDVVNSYTWNSLSIHRGSEEDQLIINLNNQDYPFVFYIDTEEYYKYKFTLTHKRSRTVIDNLSFISLYEEFENDRELLNDEWEKDISRGFYRQIQVTKVQSQLIIYGAAIIEGETEVAVTFNDDPSTTVSQVWKMSSVGMKMDYFSYVIPSSVDMSSPVKISLSVSNMAIINWLSIEPMKDVESILYLSNNNKYINQVYSPMEYLSGSELVDTSTYEQPHALEVGGTTQVKFKYNYSPEDLDVAPNVVFEGFIKGQGKISFSFQVKLPDKLTSLNVNFIGLVGVGESTEQYIATISREEKTITYSAILSSAEEQEQWKYFYISLYQLARHIPKELLVDNYSNGSKEVDLLDENYPVSGIISDAKMVVNYAGAYVEKIIQLEKGASQNLYISDLKSTITNIHSAYPYENALSSLSEEIKWKKYDVPFDGYIPLDNVYLDDFDGSSYYIYDVVVYVDASTYSKVHLTVETEGSFVLSNRYSIILQKMGFSNEVVSTVFSAQQGYTPLYLHVVFPKTAFNQNIRIQYISNGGVAISAENNREGDAISEWLISTPFYSEKNEDTVDYLNFISQVTPMEGERFEKRVVDSEGFTHTETIEFSEFTFPGFCPILDFVPHAVPSGYSVILTTTLDFAKSLNTSLVLLLNKESGITIQSLLWDETPLLYINEGVFNEIDSDLENGMITIPLNSEGLTVNSLFSPKENNPNEYGFIENDPDYNFHFSSSDPYSIKTSSVNPDSVILNNKGIHRIVIQLTFPSPYNTDFGIYLENVDDSVRTVLSPSDKAIDFHAVAQKNFIQFENDLHQPQTLAQLEKNENTLFKSRYFKDDYGQYHSYRIYSLGFSDEYTLDKGKKWKIYDGDTDDSNDVIYESTTHYNWKHVIGKMNFAIVIDEGTPQVLQLPFNFLVGYMVFCDWLDTNGDGLEDTCAPYIGLADPLDASSTYDDVKKGVVYNTEEEKKISYDVTDEQQAELKNLTVHQSLVSSLSTTVITKTEEEIPLSYTSDEIAAIQNNGLTLDRYLHSLIENDYLTYSKDIARVKITISSSNNKAIDLAYDYDKEVLFTHSIDNATGEEEKIVYDFRYDCFSVLTPDAFANDNYRVDFYTFNNKLSLYNTDLYKLKETPNSYGLFDDPQTLSPMVVLENYNYEIKETVNSLDSKDEEILNNTPTTIVDAFVQGLTLSQLSVEMYDAEIEMDYYSLDLFYSVFFNEYLTLQQFFSSQETLNNNQKHQYYPTGTIQFAIWISSILNSYIIHQSDKLFDEYQNRTSRYDSEKKAIAAMSFLLDLIIPYRGFKTYGAEPEPEETHHPRFSSYVDFKYSLVMFWGLILGNSAGCGIPKNSIPMFRDSERTGKLLMIDELWDKAIKNWNLADKSRIDDPSEYLPYTDQAVVDKILFDARVRGDEAMIDWITNEDYSAEAYYMQPYGVDYAIYYWLKAFTIQQGYDPYAIKVYTIEEMNSQEREDFDENYFVIGVPVSTIEDRYLEYNWFVSLDKETRVPTSATSQLIDFIPLVFGQSSNPHVRTMMKIIKRLGNVAKGENFGYNTFSMSEFSLIVTLEFLVNLIDIGALLIDIRDAYIGATPFIRKMSLMQIPMDILDLFTPGPFSLVGNTMNNIFKSIVGDIPTGVKGLTKTANLLDIIQNSAQGEWKSIARAAGKSELMIWIVEAAQVTYRFSTLANQFYQWFFFLPQKIFMSSLQITLNSFMIFASKMIYTIRRMDIEEATLLNIKAQEYFYQGLDDTAKMTRAILSHPKMLSRFGTEGLIERANIVAKYYMNIIIKKVMELEATSKAILESVEKSRFYVMMALRYATHMYMNTPGGVGIHFSPNLIDNDKETEGRYFSTVDNTTIRHDISNSLDIYRFNYIADSKTRLNFEKAKFTISDLEAAKIKLAISFSSLSAIHSTPETFQAYKETLEYIDERLKQITNEEGENLEYTPIWWILHVPVNADMNKYSLRPIFDENPAVSFVLRIFMLEKALNENLEKSMAEGEINFGDYDVRTEYEKEIRSSLDKILSSAPVGLSHRGFELVEDIDRKYVWRARILELFGQTQGSLCKLKTRDEFGDWVRYGRTGTDLLGLFGYEEYKQCKKTIRRILSARSQDAVSFIYYFMSLGLFGFRFYSDDESVMAQLRKDFPDHDFDTEPSISFTKLATKYGVSDFQGLMPSKEFIVQALTHLGLKGLAIDTKITNSLYSVTDSMGIFNKAIAKNILTSVAAENAYIGHGSVIYYKDKTQGEIIKDFDKNSVYFARYVDGKDTKPPMAFIPGDAILLYDTNEDRYLFLRNNYPERFFYEGFTFQKTEFLVYWFRINEVTGKGEVVYDILDHYCKDEEGKLKEGITIVGTEDVLTDMNKFYPKRNKIRSSQPIISIEVKQNGENTDYVVSMDEKLPLFKFVGGDYATPTEKDINFASFLYPSKYSGNIVFGLLDDNLEFIDEKGLWPVYMGLSPSRYTYNVKGINLENVNSAKELLDKLDKKENLPEVEVATNTNKLITRPATVQEVNQQRVYELIRWYTTNQVYTYYVSTLKKENKAFLCRAYLDDWNAVKSLGEIIEIIEDSEGYLYQKYGYKNKQEYLNFRINMIQTIINEQEQFYKYKFKDDNLSNEDKLIEFLKEQKEFFERLSKQAAKIEAFQEPFFSNLRLDIYEESLSQSILDINYETMLTLLLSNRFNSYNKIRLFEGDVPFSRNQMKFAFDNIILQLGTKTFIEEAKKMGILDLNENTDEIIDMMNKVLIKVHRNTPKIRKNIAKKVEIYGPKTAEKQILFYHKERMQRINYQKEQLKIERAEERLWKLYGEKTENKKKDLTVEQLYEIEEEFNNLNGKSIVEKTGTGMVVVENGDIYTVKIFNVISDVMYKKISIVQRGYAHDMIEKVVGLAEHISYNEGRKRTYINCAMINILYLIQALTCGNIRIDNYKNLEELKKLEEFKKILINYLGKERTERILKLFKEPMIGVKTSPRVDEKLKTGFLQTFGSVDFHQPSKTLPDIYGKYALNGMMKKNILMLLEIIYGIYYTGVKYTKDLNENLTDTIIMKFKKTIEDGKEILRLKDVKLRKEELEGEFIYTIKELNTGLDEKTKTILLKLAKKPYSSVFGPEFMSKNELQKMVDKIIDEYEKIIQLKIRNFNDIITEEDMKVVLIAEEFKIENLLKIFKTK